MPTVLIGHGSRSLYLSASLAAPTSRSSFVETAQRLENCWFRKAPSGSGAPTDPAGARGPGCSRAGKNPWTLAPRGPLRRGRSPSRPNPAPMCRTCWPARSPKAMRCWRAEISPSLPNAPVPRPSPVEHLCVLPSSILRGVSRPPSTALHRATGRSHGGGPPAGGVGRRAAGVAAPKAFYFSYP
jgi:hypothetical protein